MGDQDWCKNLIKSEQQSQSRMCTSVRVKAQSQCTQVCTSVSVKAPARHEHNLAAISNASHNSFSPWSALQCALVCANARSIVWAVCGFSNTSKCAFVDIESSFCEATSFSNKHQSVPLLWIQKHIEMRMLFLKCKPLWFKWFLQQTLRDLETRPECFQMCRLQANKHKTP